MSDLVVSSVDRERLFTSLENIVTRYMAEVSAWYDSLTASIKVSPANQTPHTILFEYRSSYSALSPKLTEFIEWPTIIL